MRKHITAAVLALSLPCAAAADPLLDAMSAELARSTAALGGAEAAPLYYLGYEVYDSSSYYLSAREGAVLAEDSSRARSLDVDARVGGPELDNTHEFKGESSGENSKKRTDFPLPFEDDADALRAGLWSLTDASYKAAQDQYARVKMNRSVTAGEEDGSADFSASTPAVYEAKAALPGFDRQALRAELRRLSAKFKPYDFIYNSELSFSAEAQNRYQVNSEGSRLISGNTYVRLIYSLFTRTADGMDLSRTVVYDSDSAAGMPPEDKISRDIDASIAELRAMRAAPPEAPYSGPVLLQSRAAAVFFHEILGHRMEGHRQKSEESGQTFAKKVGQSIMPPFLSLYDDPGLYRYGTQFLRGFYRYDDEGVPASRVSLVEKGVLRGFLMGRSPVKGFPASNGHGRRSPGHGAVARMGNLLAVSSRTVPYPELRRRLLAEVRKAGKAYGLVIADIDGGYTITERSLPQSFSVAVTLGYKVYADGRPDEPVRGLNLIGTPLQTFSRIIMTGDDYGVFNGSCGAESGWVPVSAVAPSLLFSEMETEKVQKSGSRPPALKPPYSEGR